MSDTSEQDKLVLKLCKTLDDNHSGDKIVRGLKDADKLITTVMTSDNLSPEALEQTKLAIFGLADYCARKGEFWMRRVSAKSCSI